MKTFLPALVLCLAAALQGCAGTPASEGPRLPSRAAAKAVQAPKATPEDENLLYLNIVDGLVKQQRYGAALAFLDEFAAKQKALSPRYWLLHGHALLGLGRNAEASADYARLEGTPLAADGWNGEGRAAAAASHWRAAAAQFGKAVQSDPSNADFLNNLAFAGLHTGDGAVSAAYLRQAHELAPGSDLIRNNLIIALTLTGDRAAAESLLEGIKDGARRAEVKTFVKSAIENGNLTMDGKS